MKIPLLTVAASGLLSACFIAGCETPRLATTSDESAEGRRSSNNTRSARFTNTHRSTGFPPTVRDDSGTAREDSGTVVTGEESAPSKPPVKLHMRANRPDSSRFFHESARIQERRQ